MTMTVKLRVNRIRFSEVGDHRSIVFGALLREVIPWRGCFKGASSAFRLAFCSRISGVYAVLPFGWRGFFI